MSHPAPDGLLVVDKPADWTSHDVVARGPPARRNPQGRPRRHARPDGHRRPAARHRARHPPARPPGAGRQGYDATIRLGQATITDDAEGEVLSTTDAGALTRDEVDRAAEPLRGDILQVPSTVSAIKIDGQRAYKRVRSGEDVDAPGSTGARWSVSTSRTCASVDDFVDVDVHVDCSTGTYIRALARDLGDALEVGGHLTMLRRTRVGSVDEQRAHRLDELAELASDDLPYLTLDEAARMFFDWHVVEEDQVAAVRNGRAVHVRLRPDDGRGRSRPGRRAGSGRHVPGALRAARPGRQGGRCVRARLGRPSLRRADAHGRVSWTDAPGRGPGPPRRWRNAARAGVA